MKWTSIILAGGESRRMGESKALLRLGGKSMAERLVALTRPFSSEIIVVVRPEDLTRLAFLSTDETHLVLDAPRFKGDGPLAGMYTGMTAIDSCYYFVCACDLPCLDDSYLEGLNRFVTQRPGYQAYIPVSGDKYQPFAGVYQQLSPVIEKLLEVGKRRWIDLLSSIEKSCLIQESTWRTWTKQPDPFFNMNTPSDYCKIRSGWV